MSSCSASLGWIHSGCPWLISLSHLALPPRVWIIVGSRNVGMRMRSPAAKSRSSQWTCDGIHVGRAYSGQPQSRSISEYSSSLREGVGKPARTTPSISTPTDPSPMKGMCPSMSSRSLVAAGRARAPGARRRPRGRRRRRRARLGADFVLVELVLVARERKGAVAAHVLQRGQALLGGRVRQPGHRVGEQVLVVLVHRDRLTGVGGRLEVAADAEDTVGVDVEGEVDPPLVLLPHLARVDLPGAVAPSDPAARRRP